VEFQPKQFEPSEGHWHSSASAPGAWTHQGCRSLRERRPETLWDQPDICRESLERGRAQATHYLDGERSRGPHSESADRQWRDGLAHPDRQPSTPTASPDPALESCRDQLATENVTV